LPGAGRLAHGDVELVPDVDIGDGQNQRRERLSDRADPVL
jgi:hypothetical protein